MSVFTVLHVCVGNICRSPMAERLLVHALRSHVGDRVDEVLRSHGAGTGSWHVGEAMNPPAAAELRRRGEYRILVSPDHPTPLRTKTHSHGLVPFAICGSGVAADGQSTYDEVAAEAAGLRHDPGWRLMRTFIDG